METLSQAGNNAKDKATDKTPPPEVKPSKKSRSSKKRKQSTLNSTTVEEATAPVPVPTDQQTATPARRPGEKGATESAGLSVVAKKPRDAPVATAIAAASESAEISNVKSDVADTTTAAAAPTVVVVGGAAAVPAVVPRGRSVSGRDWKVRKQSQRASMQVTTATETLSSSWAKKLELKAKRKAIIAMEQEMKDTKRQEIEDKKQEKLEREKRRQQNEMKNTTYQTISKTHKLKAMSKKQLRQIKKRQVNSRTGEIEFVSPWGGGQKHK